MAKDKIHMNLIFIGHVDHGKSTTVGRLLFDSGNVGEQELRKLKEKAEELGKGGFEFAFVMDNLKEEQERGVTIDLAHKKFDTDKYSFTIIDAPGHKDFIKNMITGTAQADSASYTNFVAMHGGSPQSLIGDTVSLYLPDDNLYFDVVFTSYTGGGGGGFSYIRTSVNSMDLDQQQLPEEYVLSNNYPNPFNPITTFNYRLPAAATVSLRVYDLNGKLVLDFNDGIKSAGRHEIILTATGLSSGTYFCVFSAGSFQTSKKVMLLK